MKADDPIQEILLRVVIELPGPQYHVIGTAVLIAGNLAITARHVLEYSIRKFGATQKPTGLEISNYSVQLFQVLPGPVYNIWNVFKAWICSTDIAILHLGLGGSSAPERPTDFRSPQLRLFPPPTGETVLAAGFREGAIAVTHKGDGSYHMDLRDKGTTSAGKVGQNFPVRRDSSMLSFPCFEVIARFAPGMSGGMIVDEQGSLCGVVCASLDSIDPDSLPLSYAATIWPMFTTIISADRGERYPRAVEYQMIELVDNGIIKAIGAENLDPSLFPGRSSQQKV